MSAPQIQELAALLAGRAHVLVSSADDYAACARSLARLQERFGPRLHRLADDAFEIAKVLQVISHRIAEAAPGSGTGGKR